MSRAARSPSRCRRAPVSSTVMKPTRYMSGSQSTIRSSVRSATAPTDARSPARATRRPTTRLPTASTTRSIRAAAIRSPSTSSLPDETGCCGEPGSASSGTYGCGTTAGACLSWPTGTCDEADVAGCRASWKVSELVIARNPFTPGVSNLAALHEPRARAERPASPLRRSAGPDYPTRVPRTPWLVLSGPPCLPADP